MQHYRQADTDNAAAAAALIILAGLLGAVLIVGGLVLAVGGLLMRGPGV